MRGASGSGDDDLNAALSCIRCIFDHPPGSAVCRHNSKFKWYSCFFKEISSGLHYRKIAVAAHYNSYQWLFHMLNLNPFEAAEKEISFNLRILVAVAAVNGIFT